ncbi:MAG: hypothetical protein V1701_00670 [Planctomycetota bacterium]
MVWDTSIAKTSKKCNACQKEFASDEVYFSSLAAINPIARSSSCPQTGKSSLIGVDSNAVKPAVDAVQAVQPAAGDAIRKHSDVSGQPVKSASKPIKTKKQVSVQDEQERFARNDFCTACWEQSGAKQPDLFSFWQMKLAAKEQPKTPKEILISFFENMINPQPQEAGNAACAIVDPALKSKVVYLFSLILIRKRLLKLKQTAVRDNQRLLILERTIENPKAALETNAEPTIKTYEVPDMDIPQEDLISLRNEFSRLFEFKI